MASDAIPQPLVDEVLAKCLRHCCICRRRDPLHLQVHHIVERGKGGKDKFDNLIAVCLTCHCDAHTQTFFTRRFSQSEIKLLRDTTYRLVAEGKLPHPGAIQVVPTQRIAEVVTDFALSGISRHELSLSPAAVEVLLEAAKGEHLILIARTRGGGTIQVGARSFVPDHSERAFQKYFAALQELVLQGCLRDRGYNGEVFEVTHNGYVLADDLSAAATATSMKEP